MLLNAFFWCINNISKKSSSFSIPSTSVIIFIKCWNGHDIKNNIRHKGNINSTSVITFFNQKLTQQKLTAMLLAWESLQWGFCDVGCNCSFIFYSLFCSCSSFVDVLHSHLLFDIIPHPSVDYRRVFTPISYFKPSPSQSDSWHFHVQPFRYLLTVSATVLSGYFLPTGVIHLTLLHRHFTCIYQGLPGSRQFFLEVCRASY